MRKTFLLIFISLFFILVPSIIHAEDFQSDYLVEYTPVENGASITAKVNLTIKITNLQSELFVKKIAFSLPKDFQIKNATAYDKDGKITPEISTDVSKITLSAEFNNPEVGKDLINTVFIEFEQDNLFQQNGNLWEVILPSLEKKAGNNYKIVLNIPKTLSKKMSIAKPKPDMISVDQLVWDNIDVKTVYLVFGESQYYNVRLNYHLKNPKFIPVYTDVAFPPDTLYQKTFLVSLSNHPNEVFLDSDNNLIGRYILAPKQNLDINYESIIEIFASPRSEVQPILQSKFSDQKKYLLNQQKYWEIDKSDYNGDYKTTRDIYNFVTLKFNYNFENVSQSNKRLGAKGALKNPDRAVCVEFTDTFIALAREVGIFAREIEGYGFSQDKRFRPISLVSDVLHSWPEYYDLNYNIWVPTDPTWENTSGIDYYNSFDLNHITFVIHGKESDYPLSAGMYKTESSKDINVKTTVISPEEKIQITVPSIKIEDLVYDSKKHQAKITLKNEGNVYLWNMPIKISAQKIKLSKEQFVIPIMAPLEKKEIEFEYSSDKVFTKSVAELNIFVLHNLVHRHKIVLYPYYYYVGLKLGIIFAGFISLFILYKLLKRFHG